ncbi:ly6/PLAUR domain-containing protein 1-like [Festucalex cinctus]
MSPQRIKERLRVPSGVLRTPLQYVPLAASSSRRLAVLQSKRTMWILVSLLALLLLFFFNSGAALQIQCYQCEEVSHDCTTPEFVVNCTVNVQDMCQKEVLVKEDGIHYRKSCASSGACLIASSGYQQFCTGKMNSVCISCCNTPLCNGPRHRRRAQASASRGLTRPHFALLVALSSIGDISRLV